MKCGGLGCQQLNLGGRDLAASLAGGHLLSHLFGLGHVTFLAHGVWLSMKVQEAHSNVTQSFGHSLAKLIHIWPTGTLQTNWPGVSVSFYKPQEVWGLFVMWHRHSEN